MRLASAGSRPPDLLRIAVYRCLPPLAVPVPELRLERIESLARVHGDALQMRQAVPASGEAHRQLAVVGHAGDVQAQSLEELSSVLDDIGNLEGVERTNSSVVLETRFRR